LHGPRIILWIALFGAAGVVVLALLYPRVGLREVAAVDQAPYDEPRTIDVRVLSNEGKLRRLWIHSGDCRTHAIDGSRGPFDVQTIVLRGTKLWMCPDPNIKKPTSETCLWGQQLELECLEPPVVSAKKIAPRRLGQILKMRIIDKSIRVITRVDLEQYIETVVMTEHPTAPFEARRVQAIVARTFAVEAMEEPRHEDAPVCDGQHCQAFASATDPKQDELAALTTKNVVLVDSKRRIAPTYFHSTCGGRTRDATDVWPGALADDVVGASDAEDKGRDWCRNSPHHRWKLTLPEDVVASAVADALGRKPDPRSLEIAAADQFGKRFAVKDKKGAELVLASALHRGLGRVVGFTKFKSADFTVTKKKKRFIFEGRGMGHGVGLCQYGAEARAQAGQSAENILRAYFPKLELAHLKSLETEKGR
jgi:SpoIID/LytB domain protein